MDGAVSPTSIATWIAIGTPLLAAFFIIWAGMRSGEGAAANRDTASLIMLGVAFLLMVLLMTASVLVGSGGMAYVWMAKAALLLGAAFAVAGMGFGLVRGLRGGRAVNGPGA